MRILSGVLFLSFFIVHLNAAEETIATVTKARGNVQLKRIGETSFSDLSSGFSLQSGDIINVGEPGFCMVIFLDDKSILKIRESTQFQFVESENTRTLNIEFGKILSDVKIERQKDFRIETSVSVASVKGTQFWSVVNKMGFDKFYGLEGQVEIFNTISGQFVTLGPGEMTLSTATGQIVTAPASPEEVPEDPEAEFEEEIEEEVEVEVEEEEPEIEEPEEEIEEEVEEEAPEEEPEVEETIEEPMEEVEEPIEEPSPEREKPFNMGLGIGSATIDGVIYNQLALRPEFRFGKLGVGLDMVIYIDNEGNFRKEEWDEVSDIADKFLYIRWAEKSDPFWFKLGALEGITLGYGGILSGYSNMMEFPSVRRVGINTGVNFAGFGAEIFMANVKDFARGGTLVGLRGTYTISKKIPLVLGVNYITDINQFSGLKDRDDDTYPDFFDDFPDSSKLWNDTDGDGIPDPHAGLDSSRWDIDADGDNLLSSLHGGTDVEELKPEPFSIEKNKSFATGIAFDIGYPILRTKSVSVDLYAEYNMLSFPAIDTQQFKRIERKGSGITIPGIRTNLFKFLNITFEYRIKREYFVPQFFDQAYDLNRVVAIEDEQGFVVYTKDMLVFKDESSKINSSGFFGSAGINIFNLAQLNASYTSMVADTIEFNSFSAFASLNAENIPKLSEASAFYQRNNEKNPFDFRNPSVNTILGYRVGYELSKGVSLVWDFRQFYRDTGSGLEPVKQTTIETQFNF